jgi:hypothetical protein
MAGNHDPGSGSAFQILIKDSQMNADPDPQHCFKGNLMEEALLGLLH